MPQPYSRLRTVVHEYLHTDLLDGSTPTDDNIHNAASRVTSELLGSAGDLLVMVVMVIIMVVVMMMVAMVTIMVVVMMMVAMMVMMIMVMVLYDYNDDDGNVMTSVLVLVEMSYIIFHEI